MAQSGAQRLLFTNGCFEPTVVQDLPSMDRLTQGMDDHLKAAFTRAVRDGEEVCAEEGYSSPQP